MIGGTPTTRRGARGPLRVGVAGRAASVLPAYVSGLRNSGAAATD